MCKSKSGRIFRVVIWVCFWKSESRRGHTAVLCPLSSSLCQPQAWFKGCNGGSSISVQKEYELFTRFEEAIMLSLHTESRRAEFVPRALAVWCSTRMPGGRQGLFVSARLPLQTGCVWLSSEHRSDSSPENSMSINRKTGAGRSPWLPRCFDLSLFFWRIVKETHKEVKWCSQNMIAMVRG